MKIQIQYNIIIEENQIKKPVENPTKTHNRHQSKQER